MATVREIAELAGVSKSTVSLVLNNKPGVSEPMRRLVMDAFDQLRMGSPRSLTSLSHGLEDVERRQPTGGRRNGTNMLSLVVLHPRSMRSSYVFSKILQGIQVAAETYHVQLRFVMNDPDGSGQHVSNLYFSDPNLRPDGVLVFGAKQDEPLIEEARRLKIPCVVLGREVTKYDVSGLGRDEAHYGYEATRYLIELGHKAIAFLGGQEVYDYTLNRVKGYQRALRDANIAAVPEWIQLGDGAQATRTALQNTPEITAVIYINDTYAAEGLPVIQEFGLTIPDDLSVVSFDDTDVARSFNPPLTSISYRQYEEAQWAVKMLIDLIHFPVVERLSVIFKGELIKRSSCAPPSR